MCKLRYDSVPEETIAAKLKFGNAEATHTQLRNWGLQGLLPKETNGPSQQLKRRKAKAGTQGAIVELPCPVDAAALFEEAVNALHRIIEDLEHYRLIYKDGRFINTYVYDDPAFVPRSDFTSEQWMELCDARGIDPTSRGYLDFNARLKAPTGGSKYPPRPLVALITVYALLERDMGALLRVLNPHFSREDGRRISGLLYKNKNDHGRDGLVRTAEQLAELVYGVGGGRGAPAGYLSAREQSVACSITEYREQGWSDKELYEHYAPLGFSKDRVLELACLGLRWPEH